MNTPRKVPVTILTGFLDGQSECEWGDEPRRNQLVFIGRNLDEQSMWQGFEACLI